MNMLKRIHTVLFASALFTCSVAVHADDLQDANKLFKQGQQNAALEKVDSYLAGKPKDAQGRFLKGLILTEQGKPNDAIKVFSDLTIDYPDLPEPYNNLAVLVRRPRPVRKRPSNRWNKRDAPYPQPCHRTRTLGRHLRKDGQSSL